MGDGRLENGGGGRSGRVLGVSQFQAYTALSCRLPSISGLKSPIRDLQVRAGSISTRMSLHLPCLNLKTLSAHRVAWPMRIAVQISTGCNPRIAWMVVQMPNGMTICETIEMYRGPRVSPVPCRPPVWTSATEINNPDTLRNVRSCTPISTTA